MTNAKFIIASAATAFLSATAAFASQRAIPNVVPQVNLKAATCAGGMVAMPGVVGPTQAYTCESGPATCLAGWTLMNVHVAANRLEYICIANSKIIK